MVRNKSLIPARASIIMDKFATSIKKKYQERCINRERQWPPCHSDKLVRLELVERKEGEGFSAHTQRGRQDRAIKRTPLAYGDLFKVESGKRPIRKVLVEGDAGIGKTTFCISVSEDWANGKLFQQFELVLLLPLRMKAIASAGCLSELLNLLHPSTRTCELVAGYLVEEKGKFVLVIADGWDELSESKRQTDSFLNQLLFQMFPLISVIVTSRPSASTSLHRLLCIDRFVEVQGFSKENIKEYIESELASDQTKANALLKQLEMNPLVESVYSVPLNCAIICHLWHTLEEALPTTMTELYTKIILDILLRNIRKTDIFKNILSLSRYDALPSDLRELWWRLCEFAYHTFSQDQIVFTWEDLANFFPQDLAFNKSILYFGLLQSTESIFEDHVLSFHFLHITFQEYLAALHLAKTLAGGQSTNQPIIEYKIFDAFYEQERFTVVWKFLFGLYFNVVGCSDSAPIKRYLSYINEQLVRCHCAFEARNVAIESDLILSLKQDFSLYYHGPTTAHDCTVVLYVIDKMQECHNIGISFSNCHIRESQIRALADTLANKHQKLQLKELDLSGNKLTYKSVCDLFDRAANAFQSLQYLNIGGNEIEPEKVLSILTKPSCRVLSSLILSGNYLGVPGLRALENAVSAGWLANLKSLSLSGCLDNDANTSAPALDTFLKSLLAHCPKLDTLHLSDNSLGAPGASAIAVAISERIMLQRSVQLKSINLSNTKLGDEGLYAFIVNLKNPCCFDHLYLRANNIHAAGISCLVDMICSNEIDLGSDYDLNGELDLQDNQLGLEGTIAISEILNKFHHIKINLSGCNLTTTERKFSHYSSQVFVDVGQQLCCMPQSCYIKVLTLDDNCFTGERIHILAGFIYLCVSLTSLYSKNCDITSDDLIQLLDILAKSKSKCPNLCRVLQIWNLDNNKIDDNGVSALIRCGPSLFLHLFKKHKSIGLCGNLISWEMFERLEKISTDKR